MTALDEFLSKDERHALLAVVAVYAAATWWYAIPFGTVWDDWVLLAHSAASLISVASEAGRVEHAFLLLPFQATGASWTWALTAWLSLCACVVLILLTARRMTGVSRGDAFWIAALTAASPFYQARFTLSVLPYAVSALCFTASLCLLASYSHRPRLALRLAALILLLLACSTSSFLTLSWIAPALIAWQVFARGRDKGADNRASILDAARVLAAHAEFLLLPPASFFIRRWLFPAHGLYATYYQLKLSLAATLDETTSVLWDQISNWNTITAVFLPTRNLATVADAIVPAGFILLSGYVARRYLRCPIATGGPKQNRAPFLIGLVLFALALLTPILALYPYIAVGQPPRFPGLWETRHQLTLMLVSGSVLVAFVRPFGGPRALDVVGAMLLFLFLTLDYGAGRQYLVDRLEQKELEHRLVAEPLPRQSLVLVKEGDRDLRMFGRFFSFYELSQMASRIDGQHDRLIVSNREIIDPLTNTYAVDANPGVVEKMLQFCKLRGRPEFGFSDFSYRGSVVTLSIDPLVERVPLATAVYLTVSGQPTDWIRLDRKNTEVDVKACPAK